MTNYPPPPTAPMNQPGIGYPPEYPRGTMILVFGILSLVCCGLFLGIPAWVMGNSALKDIARSGVVYSNRGTIKAGMICGIIGTALSALGIVFYLIVIGIAVATHNTTN